MGFVGAGGGSVTWQEVVAVPVAVGVLCSEAPRSLQQLGRSSVL